VKFYERKSNHSGDGISLIEPIKSWKKFARIATAVLDKVTSGYKNGIKATYSCLY
jgi:hypothetical protein